MARESAMLGVPGIYCGFREMKANDILIKKGMLFHSKPDEVADLAKKILNDEFNFKGQEDFRNELLNEWEDVTGLIVRTVKDFENQ
jgi:predicted glycosyltransferase